MDKLYDILNEIDAILDESAGANGALDRYRRIAAGPNPGFLKSNTINLNSTKEMAKNINYSKKSYKDHLKGGIYGDLPDSKKGRKYFKNRMDEELKNARDHAQESKNFASGKIIGVKAPNDPLGGEQTIDNNYVNPYDIAKYDRQNRKTSMADRRINHKVLRDKIKSQNESTTDILDDIDYLLNS